MAQQSCQNKQWQRAIYYFSAMLRLGAKLTVNQASLFNRTKRNFWAEQQGMAVAICGWDLSHNAAGRVLSLANLYQDAGQDVSIIGCIIETSRNRTKQLWQPMRLAGIDCEYITVSDSSSLVSKAFEFVSTHPFNVVHLSKPRLPNIIIGRLYQLLWNAKVIMDIDDEEMGFVSQPIAKEMSARHLKSFVKTVISLYSIKLNTTKLNPKSLTRLSTKPNKDDIYTIRSDYWLATSVSLAKSFAAITVSNVVLQKKYGGQILPHARDANVLVPSQKLTTLMRQKYEIAPKQKVVLFFGTPKPHKGLIETAIAISKLPSENILFLIIGDFIDLSFKAALCAVDGVDFKFLPDQPYTQISHFVAMGDVCVCLQDLQSLISQHQLPAKIIDALAMGLIVVASETPALAPLIEAGVIMPTDVKTLDKTLQTAFKQRELVTLAERNRNYFINYLSTQSQAHKLNELLAHLNSQEFAVRPNFRYSLDSLTNDILP